MDEWKDFSLRNGRKSNILGVMYYLAILILSITFSTSAFAQNTQIADVPTPVSSPQVTVEVKVVEILLNDEHRKGIDWEAIVSDFHSLQLKKEDNPVWVDKKYRLSVGEVSSEDYAVLLDALDTVGKFIQSDFPQTVLPKNESRIIDVSADPKNLPKIQLDLKCFNSPAGQLKLKLEPSFGLIIKDGSTPLIPVILKSQTDVDLKDNTTIVIGGITSEQEITKTHKFPLLGDLPLVGLVFRSQGRLMQKTETVIFLTPRLKAVAEGK